MTGWWSVIAAVWPPKGKGLRKSGLTRFNTLSWRRAFVDYDTDDLVRICIRCGQLDCVVYFFNYNLLFVEQESVFIVFF